jgi:electron transport complex protein RnfB
MATGALAEYLSSRNIMRKVDRSEARDIKLGAIKAGLVTMSVNTQFDLPNIICSCCGCCCVILRTITQFNAPGLIAPPHFTPKRDELACMNCGECVDKCPMKARKIENGIQSFAKERCIGCGICVTSCMYKALVMDPVNNYSPPPGDYFGLGRRMARGYVKYLFS